MLVLHQQHADRPNPDHGAGHNLAGVGHKHVAGVAIVGQGAARNDTDAAQRLLSQGYNRAKLRQVIGTEQADALIADLGNEATFARTRDLVTGRADAAAQAAADREIGGAGAGKAGVIRSLLNLDVGDAAAMAAGGFTDALRERRNADLARILTEVGPDRAGAQRAFAAIHRSIRAKDITSDVASKLMQTVVRGGGLEASRGLTGLPAR